MLHEPNNKIATWQKMTARAYLNPLLEELAELENKQVKIKNPSDVIRIKGLLKSGSRYFKSLEQNHFGFYNWYSQLIDFVPSNLGRGYLAYFVCNKCQQRAKFLHYKMADPPYMTEPLCRLCYGLKYPTPKRQYRQFSRLLNKPYLNQDQKRILIKHAKITLQDVQAIVLNNSP